MFPGQSGESKPCGRAGRLVVLAAVVSLSLVPPTRAFAAGEKDPRDQARARLKAGAKLMERGDYAQALAAFQEAHALFPSPKIFFNIGVANQALARYAAAHDALTRFLTDPQDAPSDSIAQAHRTLEALNKQVARVAVGSDAAGDEIYIDGQRRGATPLAAPIVVDPGSHAVAVRRGAAQHTEDLTLAPGELRSVVPRYPPPAGAAPTRVIAPPQPPPSPSPSPPLPGATAVTLSVAPAPAPAPAPLYRRPWFWGVVAGAVVAGVIVSALAFRGTEYPAVDDTVTFP